MYSRFQDRASRPIRVPENYGGCAFSASPKAARDLPPTPQPEPPTHSDAPPFPSHAPSSPASEPPQEAPAHTPLEETSVVSAPQSPPRPPLSLPFTHGWSFDELLLLGVMILLSRNEEESDVLPFFALLLFCG